MTRMMTMMHVTMMMMRTKIMTRMMVMHVTMIMTTTMTTTVTMTRKIMTINTTTTITMKRRGMTMHVKMMTAIHLFIQAISIAPPQVHYYSEALPTQHGYCVAVSRRNVTGNYE